MIPVEAFDGGEDGTRACVAVTDLLLAATAVDASGYASFSDRPPTGAKEVERVKQRRGPTAEQRTGAQARD